MGNTGCIQSGETHGAAASSVAPATLDELLGGTPEQIARCDIARMNLLCASGLPGGEDIDVSHYLNVLNRWTAHLLVETERHFDRFRQNPERFRNSEAYYRSLMLGTVLRQDFKIEYDADIRQRKPGIKHLTEPINTRNVYIHGLLGPARLGCCASMPVLYIAIGRRLGYPLRLVRGPQHLFARWENGTERFNIEATHPKGLGSPTDQHYVEHSRNRGCWLSDRDIDSGFYLGSLDSSGELGTFMHDRAACLYSHGKRMEALRAYGIAAFFNPRDSSASNGGAWLVEQELRKLAKPGTDPLDPRIAFSPQDAACACNIAAHCYEIWWGKQEPRFAWGAYLEAARLDPNEPRYRADVERFRRRMPPGIAARPAPPFYGYAFSPTPRIRSPFAPLPMGAGQMTLHDPNLAVPQSRAKPPLVVNKGKAEGFAAVGRAAESAGDFAGAREAYAFAAYFDTFRQEYHDSIHRADAKEQTRLYREKHGVVPPADWRPLKLKWVTVTPNAHAQLPHARTERQADQ